MKLKAEIRPGKGKQNRVVIKSPGNNKKIVTSENYMKKSHALKVAKALGFKNPADKTKKKKRG